MGKGKRIKLMSFMTVGTGIGAGLIVEGNLVHGLLHPEMGHMMICHEERDLFKGAVLSIKTVLREWLLDLPLKKMGTKT